MWHFNPGEQIVSPLLLGVSPLTLQHKLDTVLYRPVFQPGYIHLKNNKKDEKNVISFAQSLSCSLCMKQASDAQRKSVVLQGQENVKKPDVLFCKISMAHIFCGLSVPVCSAALFVFPSVQQECWALTLRRNLDIKAPVYAMV